jgi:hypothetical protein
MATSWAEIDAAAMVLIDDIRLTEQMEISPALYYRRMSLFVQAALPMLSRPPELLEYLTNSVEQPEYTDFEWISTEASTSAETSVETNAVGFDLCSCVINEILDDGRVLQTPYTVTYDAETGVVTFPVQDAEGIVYQLDFYKDGSFKTLSDIQIQLFASAVALVWDERFLQTWLNRTPKINDSSFSTVNEANYTEKTSQAHLRREQSFHEQLKHYEQLCTYRTRVSNRGFSGVNLV